MSIDTDNAHRQLSCQLCGKQGVATVIAGATVHAWEEMGTMNKVWLYMSQEDMAQPLLMRMNIEVCMIADIVHVADLLVDQNNPCSPVYIRSFVVHATMLRGSHMQHSCHLC
jgi:hypothetical protein